MRYVLGIDQGGTKTLALVTDEEGRILGMGRSGGACHSYHGMEPAMARVQEAVAGALEESGLTLSDISAVGAGLTGLDWDYEKELLATQLQTRLGIRKVLAVNDCIIALRAGTRSSRGCVLCAGTGFNCAVRRDPEHEIVYGYYISDHHQGGRALGQQVLGAVLHAHLGLGEPTALTEAVYDRFDVHDPDTLLYRMVSGEIGNDEAASLAPLLDKIAGEKDPVACRILENFGRELARYGVAAMRKLDLLEEPLEIVLSGSVFKCKSPDLMEGVRQEFSKAAPNAVMVNARFEPVVGAALIALDEIRGEVTPEIYDNIEAAGGRFPILRQA